MRLPLVNLPVVYHLGTLDPGSRGEHFASSYEGAGLSVSLCPEAWRSIAKLGGEPLKSLARPDALYLDLLALTEADRLAILNWAEEKGLVERREMWRAWQWDEEGDEWRYFTFATKDQAIEEAVATANVDVDVDPGDPAGTLAAVTKAIEEEYGITPPMSLVSAERMAVLTAKGNKRARGYGRDSDAFDMAAMFWAEDILRKAAPSVVGVWWRETFDPEALSSPRGAILPTCLKSMAVTEPRWMDEDEELLEAMPESRLVSPEDLRSCFRYVTCCVESTEELISPMVDSPACQDLSLEEFLKEVGGVRAGRKLLDETFPDYRASGMDIAKDWHVRYHTSSFDGMPCAYVVHSAIEYVFQRVGLLHAPRVPVAAPRASVDAEEAAPELDAPGFGS